MASNKSSIRYAKALLELAIEKNCVESIEKDLSQFLRTLKDSNDLRIFIDSPVVRNEKKIKVLIINENLKNKSFINTFLFYFCT